MMTPFKACTFALVCFLALNLTSCNLPQSTDTPSPTLNVTQAYQTVQARLTEAAAFITLPPPSTILPAANTETPTPAEPTGTLSPEITNTPVPPRPSATRVCDQAAAGNPIDVTIPDDTVLEPGKAFTKTWRLVNAGACPWTQAYSADYFSGESMSSVTSIPLSRQIEPGQSVDISVDMVAPTRSGSYQSNWKLRNANDDWFGIGPNGSAPFWVRIEVTGTLTSTVTPTPSLTPTPTETPLNAPTAAPSLTPAAPSEPTTRASGSLTLLPENLVDLDAGSVNVSGSDLLYQLTAEGMHTLTPENGAVLGSFGSRQPTLADCQLTGLFGSGVRLEDIPAGIYLCYRTDGGRYGHIVYGAFDPNTHALPIEYLTWDRP